MNVVIVDDSMIFRSLLRRVLEGIPEVKVVGSASNGRHALDLLRDHRVDFITLDMNMPEMDGLATLAALQAAGAKAKTIVFAAKTANSARDTIEALKLGAVDFIVKPESDSIEGAHEYLHGQLKPRIEALRSNAQPASASASSPATAPTPNHVALPSNAPRTRTKNRVDPIGFKPLAVVIASSTGGPMALEQAVAQLRHPLNIPVFLAQHMPANFTKALSERLSKLTGIDIREAVHDEVVKPGTIYVAPGDFHMRLMSDRGLRISLDQGPRIHFVRPAADLLFETAVAHYGSNLGAMVLTGMGSDGAIGAVHVKNAGGCVMIQNKQSAVVWGMPGAVHEAGAFDDMGNLQECALVLSRWCN